MTSKRVLFTNWIIYIIVLLAMHFWENVCVVDFLNPFRTFNLSEIILFFLGIILITAIYFYVEKKRNGFKPNYVLLSLCGFIFIYSLIIILATPSVKTFSFSSRFDPNIVYSGIYNVTSERRTYYIFFAFLSLLVIYLTLDVFPRKIAFLKVFDIGFFIMITLTSVCIIYSYIVEANKYVTIIQNFSEGIIKPYIYSVKSFWFNRSNYSMLLLFSIFYCLLVHVSHQKWWWLYVVAFFLFINLIFTTSKTNIPLALFLLLGYLLARFFITLKKHILRNIITLVSILLVIIALVTTFIILYNYSSISENLHKSIREIVSVSDGTISSRKYIWKASIDILNNSNWLYGAGFGLFNDLLREYMAFSDTINPTNMPHNYFIQIVGEGGLFYLAFIIFTFVLLIYYMVKIAKKNISLVILESLFLITFLLHACLESNGPIAHSLPSGEGVLYSYLLFVPIFSVYYNSKHPQINEEIVKNADTYQKNRNKYFSNPYSISNMIYFISTLLLVLILGPIMTYFANKITHQIIASIVIISLIYLFAIYFIQRNYNNSHNIDNSYNDLNKYIRYIMLPFLIILVILVAFSRIFMAILPSTLATMMFMILVNVVLYMSYFIVIPSFKNNGEVMYVFFANFNNKTLKVYSYFLKAN